jgi:hypothetical protein
MTAVRAASAPPASRVPYNSSHEPDLVRTRDRAPISSGSWPGSMARALAATAWMILDSAGIAGGGISTICPIQCSAPGETDSG